MLRLVGDDDMPNGPAASFDHAIFVHLNHPDPEPWRPDARYEDASPGLDLDFDLPLPVVGMTAGPRSNHPPLLWGLPQRHRQP